MDKPNRLTVGKPPSTTKILHFEYMQGTQPAQWQCKHCSSFACCDAFWFWISSNKGYEEVAEIAMFLLEFPMSSASVERSFSVICHIHTWKRNRLGRERLATLTFVNINRNFERKINRL